MSESVISFPLLGEGFRLDFMPYFELFGRKFYWYGVIIAVGFLLAVIYAMKRSKEFGLTEDNIIDLLLFGVIPCIVCARAYYVILEWDSYKGNFLSVFAIWNGGLAIYGGVIGAIIGMILFSKIKKVKFSPTADIVGLGFLIGQSVGRWGNFTNREAMSNAISASANIPWKMGLTNEYGTFYYHPCFLYESLWNAIGFVLLHFYSKKKRKYDGQIFLMYLLWYGLGRVWIEGLRSDSLYFPGTNLRVSQLVAVLCIIVAGGLLIYNIVGKSHDPDDMWVNRDKKKLVEAERLRAAANAELLLESEEFDEELSDAFRMLSSERAAHDESESEEDTAPIEPIDVKISDDTAFDETDETGKDE